MKMNNIILIGMPGVGKSSVGVILAKELGHRFIDSDLEIQEREGRLLKEIIEDDGVDAFLRIEEDVNSSLQAQHSVIATGGSAVYSGAAMAHLSELGTVVYLKLSYDELSSRLDNLAGRGVVLRAGQTLRDIYEERMPLYEKYADVTIDETGLDMEGTLTAILDALKR